jgi:hypothetical protein
MGLDRILRRRLHDLPGDGAIDRDTANADA